jgi:MFS transporter, DHA1 family, tetracycline resistance protein
MIGGIMSRISYGAPFYFAAALAAVNVVLLYFILPESLSPEHRAHPKERTRLAAVFQHGDPRMFGTIVATYFFNITGFAIMTTLFALFTEKHFGFDARQTGYLFGFIGIISVILQGGLIGRLVKMFGETALARSGLLLLSAALALLPLVPTIPMLLLVCAALAIANGLVNPTLNGLASQMIDRSWQGRALGLMQSAGSVGRLIGPLLGGWLLMFDLGKPLGLYARTPFFAGAAILLVAFVLALSVRKPGADKASPPVRVEADV